MRFSFVIALFFFMSATSAQLLGLLGAAKGAAALGASVAKLASAAVPAGLLLPLAVLGPLKLSLPVLLGMKGLGLLKLKLLMLKAPLLAPIGIGAGKLALLKAKLGLAKAAFATAKKAKVGLIGLPLKLSAMKIGAIAGAKAGAKAGLASYKTFPKSQLIHPMVIPASALLSHQKTVVTPAAKSSAYAMPEPVEPEAPAYGRKPTSAPAYTPAPPAYTPAPPAYTPAPPAYTPAPPAYTPAPPAYTPAPPAYTPAPPAYTPAPQVSYRRKREVTESITESALREIFNYMLSFDSDRCVLRVVCELAVQPDLAGSQGEDVIKFMTSLDESDPDAPWMSYKAAAVTGKTTRSRKTCHKKYNQCRKSTEELINVALGRMHGSEA